MGHTIFMLIDIIIKSIVKASFVCFSNTDASIDFMIPILSDTFDTIYNRTRSYLRF